MTEYIPPHPPRKNSIEIWSMDNPVLYPLEITGRAGTIIICKIAGQTQKTGIARPHRDDGPAVIIGDQIEWWMFGTNITKQVTAWIERDKIADWHFWTDKEKMIFKIKFGGK